MRLAMPDEPSARPSRCEWRFRVIREFMPPGGVGAELGVFKGSFVAYLLSTGPSKLYLVDPWYRLSPTWPWAKSDNSTVRALVTILQEYQPEIEQKLIEPRIEFSQEFLTSLPDGHLDWAYIDSSHQYETTVEELRLCLTKVKRDGFIIGDDYDPDPTARHHGVYKAVQEARQRRDIRLVREENRQFVAALS